ncbi:MAG: 4Fe-4S binding protein [Clostridiales bacterium]|nr:4Fe-4S binding protein [Clostridiales bacterium]
MKEYHHSVRLVEDKCIGCTDCIKRCPTEAIRVRDGKARIINELCIDCGVCIKVCQSRAKKATTDPLETIKKYKYRIALPAPTLYGQFKNLYDVNVILSALKKIGFDDVFEVSGAAEMATEKTKELIKNNALKKPIISSACPVIIRLIGMRFPSLIDNILPVISPVEAAALLARVHYAKKGIADEDLGIFFISPCAAKATYVFNPLGVKESAISGVIAIPDIYMPLRNAISNLAEIEPLSHSSEKGMDWALTGGESKSVQIENAIAVDGLENVINVLEEIENGQINDVDFIEALACNGGCVGGPLTIINSFIAKNNITRTEKCTKALSPDKKRQIDFTPDQISFGFNKAIEQVGVMKLSENMSEAIRKLEKIEEIYKKLPMIDCGSCGAPTCRALAEDVVKGSANVEDCIFMLRQKVHDLAEMMVDLSAKLPQTISDGETPVNH